MNGMDLDKRGYFMAEMTTTTVRQQLHVLVDELPESELYTAKRFLHYLHDTSDPVLQALLQAPEDDEIETPEEAAAVAGARVALGEGRVVSDEELARRLGL